MCEERLKVHRKHKTVFTCVCFHLYKAQNLIALSHKCKSQTRQTLFQGFHQEDHSTERLDSESAVRAGVSVIVSESHSVMLRWRATACIWWLGKMRFVDTDPQSKTKTGTGGFLVGRAGDRQLCKL